MNEESKRNSRGQLDSVMIIRLTVAALIFATAVIFKMPQIVTVILLLLSIIAAGYDIALKAIGCVEEGKYFATPLILILVAVISFVIGFGYEGAAVIILYQLGQLIIEYTANRSKRTAFGLLAYQNNQTAETVKGIISDSENAKMRIASDVEASAGFMLKIAAGIALLYAILVPIFTNFTFTVSIHRALMILVIATPASVVAAMPITGIYGICFSAQQGTIFKSAAALEKMSECKVGIFDKVGIFTAECPKVISVQSELLDSKTFMNFAAHAVYYSELPVAKAIAAVSNIDYKLDIISDFNEISGLGVEVEISGMHVILARKEYFVSNGIDVPGSAENGQAYYLTVSGRYVGKIVISSDYNSDCANLGADIKDAGMEKIVLLSEDPEEASEQAADDLGFDIGCSNCGTEQKLAKIVEIKDTYAKKTAYVYASGIESHSAADVDLRVSRKGKYADALINPDALSQLPAVYHSCKRTMYVAAENAIIAYIVKAVLILLSIVGVCSVWFAMFIDIAAAIATILNASRVTGKAVVGSGEIK